MQRAMSSGLKYGALDEELSKAGALPSLNKGEPKQAALECYRWLLKESLPKERHDTAPSLYDMLSYMLGKSERLGFIYDTKLEQGKMVIMIESKDHQNKTVPIILELLLAHIFENLGNFDSDITSSESGITAKITLHKTS